MIKIKENVNILEMLKNKGYNTTRIRKEKILSESTMTAIRRNEDVNINLKAINAICNIIERQPGYFLEWVPDSEQTERD